MLADPQLTCEDMNDDAIVAIDTIDGFTLFKKKDVRLDPNYLKMSDKEKTERDLKISRKYEKYLLMFISQIKKKRNRKQKREKKEKSKLTYGDYFYCLSLPEINLHWNIFLCVQLRFIA